MYSLTRYPVASADLKKFLSKVLPWGFCCAVILLAKWAAYGRNLDDAYITYRYAVNIASGEGFVYNAGEKVLGTTTPLYTMILAGVHFLGLKDLPSFSTALGIASAAGVTLLAFLLAKRIDGLIAAVFAGALLAFDPFFIALSTSGMETNLYALLILLSYYAYSRGHTKGSFIVAALCFLMRPDGAFVLASLFFVEALRTKKIPIQPALLAFLVILPWLVFASYYFGSALPLSMVAKQAHGVMENTDRWWMLKTFISRPYFFHLPLFVAGSLTPFLYKEKRYEILALVFGFAIYVAAYILVGIPEYPWYKVPAIPLFHIIVAVGLATLVKTVRNSVRISHSNIANFALALIILIAGFVWFYQTRYMFLLIPNSRQQHYESELAREEASIWLHDHTEDDVVIASTGIGYVGYYSERKILDLAGLVTPQAIGKTWTEAIDYFQPDYVIVVSPTDTSFGAKSFSPNYKLVKTWTRGKDIYGPHVLWARVD